MSQAPARRAYRWLRAQALSSVFWLLGWLPMSAALALGSALGAIAFRVLSRERKQALQTLEIAFPERSDGERLALARACFSHLGRSALELPQLARIDLRSYVAWPAEQIAALRAALAGGRGGILALAHVGNWELIGPRMLAEGFDGVAIGRDSGDSALAGKIEAFRRRQGVPIVGRGPSAGRGRSSASGSVRAILRALKAGKLVAVLIDQDTRVESQFVPFFGRLASTPRAAETLARLSPSCCALALIHRRPSGGHQLTTEVFDLRAPQLTARLTAGIEEHIRRHPAEWVWMHDRWKRRPTQEIPAGDPARLHSVR